MARMMIALAAMLAPILAGAGPAAADPAQGSVLARYAAEAKAAAPSFTGFSAERGKALFLASPAGGKPDTPSCTSCHTSNPAQPGRTRAGKSIGPMAVSAKADRYTDIAETEKWFGRNCDSVLGRSCTPIEKGDFITFMIGQ
jgi:mono/diheme cytochrome c family protein